MGLQRGRDVREQDKLRVLVLPGQRRREGFEHAKFREQCAAVVHIYFVFARPVKSFSGQNLQALQIDFVTLVEPDVLLGEIIPDNPDELNRREETGRHCRMAC